MQETDVKALRPLLTNEQAYNAVMTFFKNETQRIMGDVQKCPMREEKIDLIERMAQVDYMKNELERGRIKVIKSRT